MENHRSNNAVDPFAVIAKFCEDGGGVYGSAHGSAEAYNSDQRATNNSWTTDVFLEHE